MSSPKVIADIPCHRRARVVALYRLPFRADDYEYSSILWDADNNTIADLRGGDKHNSIRPRGWGRIQYLPDAAELHDDAELLIHELCRDHPTDKFLCAEALTRFWKEELEKCGCLLCVASRTRV